MLSSHPCGHVDGTVVPAAGWVTHVVQLLLRQCYVQRSQRDVAVCRVLGLTVGRRSSAGRDKDKAGQLAVSTSSVPGPLPSDNLCGGRRGFRGHAL